jgi:branched-chain amino acid transport system permease protein
VRAVAENGLVIGAVYGLMAVGPVLTFKNSRVLDFAQPQIGMLGGFVFYVLWVEQGLPYPLAAGLAVVLGGAMGLAVQTLLRGREHEPVEMLLGTVGLGGVLLFIGMDVWGVSPTYVPPIGATTTLEVLGLRFSGPRLVALGAAGLAVVVLGAFFRFTSAGVSFRATADDPYAARLIGVNVSRQRAATWIASGALATVAGIAAAPLVTFNPFFTSLLFVRALTAALLARLVNIPAAVAAGIGLGVGEAWLAYVTPTPGIPEAVLVLGVVILLVLRAGSTSTRSTA